MVPIALSGDALHQCQRKTISNMPGMKAYYGQYVPVETARECGYDSLLEARNAFYQKAKVGTTSCLNRYQPLTTDRPCTMPGLKKTLM